MTKQHVKIQDNFYDPTNNEDSDILEGDDEDNQILYKAGHVLDQKI